MTKGASRKVGRVLRKSLRPLARVRNFYRGSMRRFAYGRTIRQCEVNGTRVLLHVGSDVERYRARTYATKEPETLEWIDRYFKPDDVFYDIGANVGLYSLYAAKRLDGKCRVFAFEPEAANFARLNQNVHLNGLSGVVVPYGVAVAGRECLDLFYLNPGNFESMAAGEGLVGGTSLHSFGRPIDYDGKSFVPFHVQGCFGTTIDRLWNELGLPFPNHIKIDVDGLEPQIIAGARTTLADPRLRSLLVEISEDEEGSREILRTMAGVGFAVVDDFAAHSATQLKGTPFERCRNTVFLRRGAGGRAAVGLLAGKAA